MPKKKTYGADSVVALETSVGETLVIRSNPSDDEVRSFIGEHTRRYLQGEPGGPSGIQAFRIFNAKRYDTEESLLSGDAGDTIEVSDLLPT